MVCIAAFIILCVIGVFVAFLSIFKPAIGKRYWQIFKKSWACISKKVRLQKCETGFKDDVKNTLLSRVVIKRPHLVKPLSIVIEICSVLIVVIAVWSLATATKSLLALWTLGTCNVTKPASCSLGAEACGIDETAPKNIFESTGRWFTEWGEIFSAIPDKFRSYDLDQLQLTSIVVPSSAENPDPHRPTIYDIIDPGCIVCARAFLTQKSAGYFDKYQVKIIPFAILSANTDGTKFPNSDLIVRYLFAMEIIRPHSSICLLDHIFSDHDADDVSIQERFNHDYDEKTARTALEDWLTTQNFSAEEVSRVRSLANSVFITSQINKNRQIIEQELRLKSIPTTFYQGKKYVGVFKAD